MNSDIIITKSFEALDIYLLNKLDEQCSYSYDYKSELIEKLDKLFKEYKSQGIKSLVTKEIKCMFCYPNKPSYEFYNPETKEMVCRYVIFKESEDFIRIEECTNKKTFNPFSKENLP